MYSYIVIEGETIIGGWQTEWDSYTDEPERQIVRITDEEFNNINKKMEHYSFRNNKLAKRSKTEIDSIEIAKKDWIDNHTITGLQKQIKNLKPKKL